MRTQNCYLLDDITEAVKHVGGVKYHHVRLHKKSHNEFRKKPMGDILQERACYRQIHHERKNIFEAEWCAGGS